jgi:hypothetical protein
MEYYSALQYVKDAGAVGDYSPAVPAYLCGAGRLAGQTCLL